MGKQRCWFGLVKKIFISDAKPKSEKKSRKWKLIFGRLNLEKYHHALPAPDKSLCQATEDQRKHVLNVAIATAAAAEAAIAAAQAAAEVVRLTTTSKPFNHLTTLDRNQAAVRIQTAFRAHLARKALRALKGLVKLQAIVRGRAVRRQATINRKSLQSGTKMYTSSSATQVICQDSRRKLTLMHKDDLQDKAIKYECNSQRIWNDSVLSKEDIEAKLLRSKEAMAKRARMKKYSYSNRERANTRMLDDSVHAETNERERPMTSTPSKSSNFSTFEVDGPPRLRFRNVQKEDTTNGTNSSGSFPRTSFSRLQQNRAGDEGSISNSPVFPTYMAATESAMAKSRSMSTPKQRVRFLDSCFDCSVPYKDGLHAYRVCMHL